MFQDCCLGVRPRGGLDWLAALRKLFKVTSTDLWKHIGDGHKYTTRLFKSHTRPIACPASGRPTALTNDEMEQEIHAGAFIWASADNYKTHFSEAQTKDWRICSWPLTFLGKHKGQSPGFPRQSPLRISRDLLPDMMPLGLEIVQEEGNLWLAVLTAGALRTSWVRRGRGWSHAWLLPVAAGPEGKVPLTAALGFLHWDRQLKSN